jgi:diketogulonate reductase-like aldo/keto reductase
LPDAEGKYNETPAMVAGALGRFIEQGWVNLVGGCCGTTPAQIALAWALRAPDLIAIPKASRPEHIRQNRAAFDMQLTDDDLEKLDETFPPPKRKIPLEML